MRKQISYFLAALIIAMAAMFAFASTSTKAGVSSCRTQCRVAYDKCVKETSNPGGLNQCRRAYQGCLSGCS
jgi:hypothetical protein